MNVTKHSKVMRSLNILEFCETLPGVAASQKNAHMLNEAVMTAKEDA
jgi:hypothetical protein